VTTFQNGGFWRFRGLACMHPIAEPSLVTIQVASSRFHLGVYFGDRAYPASLTQALGCDTRCVLCLEEAFPQC
jgi:hypothetical protein